MTLNGPASIVRTHYETLVVMDTALTRTAEFYNHNKKEWEVSFLLPKNDGGGVVF